MKQNYTNIITQLYYDKLLPNFELFQLHCKSFIYWPQKNFYDRKLLQFPAPKFHTITSWVFKGIISSKSNQLNSCFQLLWNSKSVAVAVPNSAFQFPSTQLSNRIISNLGCFVIHGKECSSNKTFSQWYFVATKYFMSLENWITLPEKKFVACHFIKFE